MLGVCVLLQLQREGPEAHIHTAHCIKAARTSNVIPSVSKKKKKKKLENLLTSFFWVPKGGTTGQKTQLIQTLCTSPSTTMSQSL